MSLGYAEKLSYRDDLGGQLGSKELFEAEDELNRKISQLVTMVQESRRIVAFTGAGISTACGIPDFRGPKGVWTMQRAGQPIPQAAITFAAAKPSLTHQALMELLNLGKLTYIVSQNVDSLHLRSGIPRDKLAELHGNCFAERCAKCRHEYIRDFEVETVGFKATGRKCSQTGCRGVLKDHVLDWEDALPADELAESERQASSADMAICLGTSLQITPACNLPLRTVKAGGKLVILNLQQTPKDKKASLVIHAKCDQVMAQVMAKLGLPIPEYTRTDSVLLRCLQSVIFNATDPSLRRVRVEVCNVHDPKAPLKLVASATITLTKEGVKVASEQVSEPHFALEADLHLPADICISCTLRLTDAADPDKREVTLSSSMRLERAARRSQNVCFSSLTPFVTQVLQYGKAPDTSSNACPGRDAKRMKLEDVALSEQGAKTSPEIL